MREAPTGGLGVNHERKKMAIIGFATGIFLEIGDICMKNFPCSQHGWSKLCCGVKYFYFFDIATVKLNPVNCIWICIAMGSNDPG
jgi:hypothetical protein